MHRPSAEEFLLTLLDTLEDLPPDLAKRLAAVLKQPDQDRAQALRQVFEDLARE